MTVTIALEPPRQPGVLRLLELSDAYAASLYPAESNHMVDISTLEGADTSFFVARRGNDILGCGALVESGDGTAEIKRMFVDQEARGLKLGKRLMEVIVNRARELNLFAIRLETGIHQPQAIGLYKANGFVEIEAFGSYSPDPLSIFMEMRLS
ncbi:GNAT family N-acetyltransferase [Rhizobium sp. XQZ8]|uniref:GNAT family N-acetyltransferase n=1 Tax=Rhizobium populisoli TaxID=2859785 RepID=UPI001C66F9ED|nr:GNAT family N-acetyltransferase [Rhizobium populisoli]MBW6424759.1 GNAT family N-acetyltransferase [Rhizobium populisoli]